MRRHSAFPALVASLRTRIAQELQLSGHLLVLSASCKVMWSFGSSKLCQWFRLLAQDRPPSRLCFTASLDAIARWPFGTMFKYILLYEDFRNLQNNQLFCLRGHWMHALGA